MKEIKNKPFLNFLQYTYDFLLLSPPAKGLSSDVIMHAVPFWGQERGLPVGRECPTCDQKRKEARGKKNHWP